MPRLRSLRLERIEARLSGLWESHLGLVVGPAGSGKTTLIAGFAESLSVPVAWYRAESWDVSPGRLLRHLQSAFATAVEGRRGAGRWAHGDAWGSVEAAVDALESWSGDPLLLVVDDLHSLESSEAESTLERFIDYAPRSLSVLAASRSQPVFNLSRRRLSGGLLEVGADDLRFRSWEVERLFREVYEEPLPPQEVAVLARRTEGWAAGLQLFHLAIRGKSADERRRLMQGGGTSARLIREYLARNVLADLPDSLRAFLVATCVFGRLNGQIADEFLATRGSRALLEELERRQIFTIPLDDDGWYRYHEVLRSHLEAMLVEECGEEETRNHYRRAGRLLAAMEQTPDALCAFTRAGDWEDVDRVLASRGESVSETSDSATWLDTIPPSVARHDPWLILASARRARDDGRWAAAVDNFAQAEEAFGPSEGAARARRERLALATWFEPGLTRPGDWSSLLRAAVTRDPLLARRQAESLKEPHRSLVAGLASLVAGRPTDAVRDLGAAAAHPEAGRAVVAGASLGRAVAWLLAGDPRAAADLEIAARESERALAVWVGRLGAAVSLVAAPSDGSSGADEIAAIRASCVALGDTWGELLLRIAEGWASIGSNPASAEAAVEPAIGLAQRSGATSLEAWARSLRALAAARTGSGSARELGMQAELFARTVGVVAARTVAHVALAEADPAREADYVALATSAGAEAGFVWPKRHAASGSFEAGRLPSVRPLEIRCFGKFSIRIDHHPIDLRSIRPRARTLLHLLVVNANRPVHREVIEAAIWPIGRSDRNPNRLHVAISAIRRLLEPDTPRGASSYVIRDSDAYRLALPDGAFIDIVAFEEAVAEARLARVRDDRPQAVAACRRALELHAGELLAAEGPADWIVERRERYRGMAVGTAQLLADLALEAGDPATAVEACSAGLSVDRYQDPLWRTLIAAHERAGDPGASTRARMEYQTVLADLGLPIDEGGKGPPDSWAHLEPAGRAPVTEVSSRSYSRA